MRFNDVTIECAEDSAHYRPARAAVLPPPRKRRRRRHEAWRKARICKSIAASHQWGLPLPCVASRWRASEHGDRSINIDGIEERNCQLFRHPNTPVGSGISRQISGVHSISAGKTHEVMHRSGNEFTATWDCHVRIGVGDNCIPARIHNFPVHARIVVTFFLQNFE